MKLGGSFPSLGEISVARQVWEKNIRRRVLNDCGGIDAQSITNIKFYVLCLIYYTCFISLLFHDIL